MMYRVVSLFIALDFVTGLTKAFKEKNFTSSIMREGLFHKCGSILCLLFGALVSYAQHYFDFGANVPIDGAICTYIAIMECMSIVENLGKINPQIIPEKIKSYFTKLK